MADLTCPHCKAEAVRYYVQMECVNGHKYGDTVERPAGATKPTPPPQQTTMTSEIKMPFGKHKGLPISDLPADYLNWALENLQDLRPYLRDEMQNQLDLKSGKGVVRQDVKITGTKVKIR